MLPPIDWRQKKKILKYLLKRKKKEKKDNNNENKMKLKTMQSTRPNRRNQICSQVNDYFSAQNDSIIKRTSI